MKTKLIILNFLYNNNYFKWNILNSYEFIVYESADPFEVRLKS